MPIDAHPVVEQLVIQFPTLAAWLIVGLVAIIAFGGALATRKFLARLDTQDESLRKIEELLASEIGKLREMHHDIDRRVVRLEVQNEEKRGRRWDDQDHNGGAD